jgi:hypothetical protein
LDLDYPLDKGSITAHDLWDRWRNHKSLEERHNKRADDGEIGYCDDYYCMVDITEHMVDITEHTLDGKAFNR